MTIGSVGAMLCSGGAVLDVGFDVLFLRGMRCDGLFSTLASSGGDLRSSIYMGMRESLVVVISAATATMARFLYFFVILVVGGVPMVDAYLTMLSDNLLFKLVICYANLISA